jgi:hypothetical protein
VSGVTADLVWRASAVLALAGTGFVAVESLSTRLTMDGPLPPLSSAVCGSGVPGVAVLASIGCASLALVVAAAKGLGARPLGLSAFLLLGAFLAAWNAAAVCGWSFVQ